MKTILVNPPQNTNYPQPPLGLASIAAILEAIEYKVEILDLNVVGLSMSEIVKKVRNVDVICITAMTPTINSAINIARSIKEDRPDSTIIMGGCHVTLLPEETLTNVPEVDLIVRGEGEESILEVFKAIDTGSDMKNIKGITYRRNGRIRSTPLRSPISDLDALPFPSYHLLPLKKYKPHSPHGRKLPFMAMITSRGCPFRCIYCSKPVFGSKFRAQSPKRTVDEIIHLKEKFGVEEIMFYDDVFTLDRKRVIQLTQELNERGLDIPWSCETGVNLVDSELLKEMKKAGCYMISFGVESGSQKILNNLRKKISLNQAERAFKMSHDAGIQSVGYFMIGSPGETHTTIKQTIDFAKKLEADFAQFSVTTPFPGTDLYDLYLNSMNKNTKWDDFIYASLKSSSAPVFETESLSKEDLRNWNVRAYKEFYFRLSYIWKRFIGMRSIGDLKTNIKGFLMFLDMVRSK